MAKTKKQIEEEVQEIKAAIKQVAEKSKTNYVQSWWLNTRNFTLKSPLTTGQINSRCRILVKRGELTIDQKTTGPSTGTCYVLTDKFYQ